MDEANAKAKSIVEAANDEARTVTTTAKQQSEQSKSAADKVVAERRQALDLELQNSREEQVGRASCRERG